MKREFCAKLVVLRDEKGIVDNKESNGLMAQFVICFQINQKSSHMTSHIFRAMSKA